MYKIKVDFVDTISEIACEAFGVYSVLHDGIFSHWDKTSSTPNSRIFIAEDEPSKAKHIIRFTPTHNEIHEILLNNNGIIFNLYLGELVQHWYDFLCNIYKACLISNIAGKTSYSIPNEKISINLSLISKELIDEVIFSAVKNFDFLPASEKIKIIGQF